MSEGFIEAFSENGTATGKDYWPMELEISGQSGYPETPFD
jgi:hypothetical protein